MTVVRDAKPIPDRTSPVGSVRHVINAAISEKEFAQWVVDFASLHGWRVFRVWNSQRSPAGWPDLSMVRRRDRRLVFAELKVQNPKKGKVSEDQQAWLDDLHFVASLPLVSAIRTDTRPIPEVYLWRPSDAAEIERILA